MVNQQNGGEEENKVDSHPAIQEQLMKIAKLTSWQGNQKGRAIVEQTNAILKSSIGDFEQVLAEQIPDSNTTEVYKAGNHQEIAIANVKPKSLAEAQLL